MDSIKKNSLMVVDDDTANLMELTHILRPDFKVYIVKDGVTALEKAAESLPDLILLDVIMPNMSGFDVLRELQKSEITKNIPVIFITGINENENESEGLAIGAVDYIRKPFDAAIVKLRVNNQIKIINLQRELKDAVRAAENCAIEAETANKTKSVFLANMSHEIRTPMNAIMGITEIMLQNEQTREVEEGLNKIYNSCDLLLGIINDILDFSKIEAGKLDIFPAKYKLASMINDSIQLNIMRNDDKSIHFKLEIDENIPANLIGDELRIKQILNNLMSNAFKYTDKGRIILFVGFEPAEKGVTLVMGVRDTGHGMTKEQMAKLFSEYSRFHEETSNEEGTGLGLAITQRLLNLMSGEISVESEPGVGSLFTIKLPQETENGEILGAKVAENLKCFRTSHTKKRRQVIRDPMPYGRVLVVDDVETNLYVAVGLMKPYQLQIDSVSCGREAIKKIESGEVYDLIFMDHMMPEMDGIEVTKHLRGLGYKKPIVALSANAVTGQAEIFLQNGFDDFVSKPIDIRQLNAVLNKYVRDVQPPEVIEAARREKVIEKNEVESTDALFLDSLIKDVTKAVTVLGDLIKTPEWAENEKDLRTFTITVHGMKSSLHSAGENSLSAFAKKLELASRDKLHEFITDSAPKFLEELRTLYEKLDLKRGTENSNESTEELKNKFSEIKEMCSQYNRIGALDIISGIKNSSPEVQAVLDRICDFIHSGDYDDAENAAAEFSSNLTLKIPGLDVTEGLKKYNDDEKIYLQILNSYATSTRSILNEIKEIDINADFDKFRLKVHSLRGTSLDIFANEIGNAAAKLEDAAIAGDLKYIIEHTSAFAEEAYKLVNGIDEVLKKINDKNPKPKKDTPDKELLLKLRDACEIYSMDGVNNAMDEIEKYQYESDDGLVDWIREKIKTMDFMQIVERISI
ncbi:MAG: response regulator [Defluviitaleaceae bacterium]|nr:response regulator [Defluviitaleaceae bacterium]